MDCVLGLTQLMVWVPSPPCALLAPPAIGLLLIIISSPYLIGPSFDSRIRQIHVNIPLDFQYSNIIFATLRFLRMILDMLSSRENWFEHIVVHLFRSFFLID